MLASTGVDLARPNPSRTWEVFKEFAAIPIDDLPSDDADGFLFEYGVYDWGDGEYFNWGFCRQFILYDGDEYDHMEQLHCTFYYEPAPALRELGSGELWSFGLSLPEWIAQVERMPGFDATREQIPVSARIEQWEV
jgi:hypothetical protein